YAEGEAELGWVNLSARLVEVSSAIDLDHLASGLVRRVASMVTDAGGEIAHVKVSVLGGDCQAVANVVANDLQVDVGLAAKRSVSGSLQIVINARVALEPQELEEICHDAVGEVTSSYDATLEVGLSHALRPGRPVPTYRVTI
ncbi:MAG: cobalamin biosynthesis protein P47K, partial [Planctomycetota bacterium]|nr:cobalamin biosynthesis protein P47K [Planctomycetota bacterium]